MFSRMKDSEPVDRSIIEVLPAKNAVDTPPASVTPCGITLCLKIRSSWRKAPTFPSPVTRLVARHFNPAQATMRDCRQSMSCQA